ncbi:DUF6125 family protein [Desulfatibacillum aliphaticivorans]|nr:DUF6125 family protein [Desulfatibacillum aliphaticivorans]
MSRLDAINKKDLRELLCMGWMTHDGSWFSSVLQKYGAKAASDLNRQAILAMSAFEVPRLKKALGMEEVTAYEQLREFIEGGFDLIGADFMQFKRIYPGADIIRWEEPDNGCFAYKGIKRLGALDDYDCGIFYRVEAWLKGLGIKYTVTPEVHGCLRHQGKPCFREYKVEL